MASTILFVIVCVASCEKSCKRVTPPLQLERFLFVIVALRVARKIASCNMAFSPVKICRSMFYKPNTEVVNVSCCKSFPFSNFANCLNIPWQFRRMKLWVGNKYALASLSPYFW